MPGIRILVVDDEKNIRNAIGRWFEAKGFDVDLADDGDAAIEKCTENEYDVVTMDLEMPRMSGTAAITAIKRLHPAVPIIVLTGYFNRADEVMTCGASKVLAKPIRLSELEKEVRAVLAT
jgi:DNA-binding response OmpR family regulator